MSWLQRLADDLAREHGAVAVIVYGSYARGAARPESDVDVCIVVPEGATGRTRDARRVAGPARPDAAEIDLDAWLYPPSALDPVKDPGLLRLRGGLPLFDPSGLAVSLLAELEQIHQRGPEPIPDDERAALEVWAARMLRRVTLPDGVAAHGPDPRALMAAWRRAEFLVALLPDIYRMRRWWYPGPEPALRELAVLDPALYRAWVAALAPDAPVAALQALVAHVFPSPSAS